MVEIKSEIENTIKMGRKLAKDPNTRNPKALDSRIDLLKHLYNELGETVTTSKKTLDSLLKLYEGIKENFEEIDIWLEYQESSDQELVRCSGGNMTITEVEDLFKRCAEMYEEYATTVDPYYLDEIKIRLEELTKRFNVVNMQDITKRITEMKSTLQNMDTISLENLK